MTSNPVKPRVDVRDNPALSRYEASADGEIAGYAYYTLRDDRVVFTHTEIFDAFAGRGVGSALAAGALDDVRATGRTLIPLCPFIAGYIGKHTDYLDLVDPAYRERITTA